MDIIMDTCELPLQVCARVYACLPSEREQESKRARTEGTVWLGQCPLFDQRVMHTRRLRIPMKRKTPKHRKS